MASIFKYCPNCGAAGVTQPSANLIECANCGFHFYRNPAVAVAALIVDERGQILLIRRAKDPAKSKLAMVGGFVDFDETAEAAVRREVKEEINLDLSAIEFLSSHPNEYHYRGIVYPVLDLFFVARVNSWHEAQAVSEVESLVARDPKTVEPEELAFESMRQALERYKLAH